MYKTKRIFVIMLVVLIVWIVLVFGNDVFYLELSDISQRHAKEVANLNELVNHVTTNRDEVKHERDQAMKNSGSWSLLTLY